MTAALGTDCDYTASGRCLRFIENFMQECVMPMYANTHTEARYRTAALGAQRMRSAAGSAQPGVPLAHAAARRSATGAQTTMFREEARETIKRLLGCTEDVSAPRAFAEARVPAWR